jgi:hypothetical protein
MLRIVAKTLIGSVASVRGSVVPGIDSFDTIVFKERSSVMTGSINSKALGYS